MKIIKYQCNDCGDTFTESKAIYLCPKCSILNNPLSPPKGILKVVYDYDKLIKDGTTYSQLEENYFLDLLPIENNKSLPYLKVGNTPLYPISTIENSKLPFKLFIKDDSQNPTYSFKDRASAIVSAFAKENSLDTIITASTGNAGSSLAGICAAQKQKAIILVPESAPLAKLTQIIMYGATLVPIKGNYDDAFDLSIEASENFGWYNRNTAFNPLTIEGKKTVSLELFKQLNNSIPDRIFVPVGDGVIISGVYKGFEDLLKLKIIDQMPTIVGVQASKSDNLIRNINKTEFKIKESTTIADSISVDIPRNFYMAKKYIEKYDGEYLTVSDEEILNASYILSSNTGLFAEPASAAAFAGLLSYKDSNKIDDYSSNIVLHTASGLKDLNSVKSIVKMPKPIVPTLEMLKNILI